jgi:hypothetical protein
MPVLNSVQVQTVNDPGLLPDDGSTNVRILKPKISREGRLKYLSTRKRVSLPPKCCLRNLACVLHKFQLLMSQKVYERKLAPTGKVPTEAMVTKDDNVPVDECPPLVKLPGSIQTLCAQKQKQNGVTRRCHFCTLGLCKDMHFQTASAAEPQSDRFNVSLQRLWYLHSFSSCF